jgi:hypothetical protein
VRVIKFDRKTNESLVIVKCSFPNHEIDLAIDTGASHTTIDLTALQIAGYDISQSIRQIQIETAGGVIEAYVFLVNSFTSMGIIKNNFEICAYDFFAHNVLAQFDGVLGINFFDDKKICIDFINSEITIS